MIPSPISVDGIESSGRINGGKGLVAAARNGSGALLEVRLRSSDLYRGH